MTVDTMRSSTLQAGWRRFARLASLLPWRSLRRLLMREFSVAEASFVLMAGFLLAALLGAVRQVLFHAQFGAGSEASAFSAALRLPDVLFNVLTSGALSSALISESRVRLIPSPPILIGLLSLPLSRSRQSFIWLQRQRSCSSESVTKISSSLRT